MTDKEFMLQKLAEMPEAVIAMAYLYAVNYTEYGVDITKEWTTAVQQSCALEQAYQRGYCEAREMLHKVMAEFNENLEG